MIGRAMVALALVAVVQQPQTDSHARPEPYDVPEAYEVYAVLLPSEWTWKDAKASNLVIQEETDAWSASGPLKPVRACYPSTPEFLARYDEVMSAFERVNQQPKLLLRKLTIEKPYKLVPKSAIAEAFKDGTLKGWAAFYDRFPESGGYLDVSAVSFNADKTQALVYIGHECGNLCGGGTYHLLEKNGGKWEEVIRSGCMWAS